MYRIIEGCLYMAVAIFLKKKKNNLNHFLDYQNKKLLGYKIIFSTYNTYLF